MANQTCRQRSALAAIITVLTLVLAGCGMSDSKLAELCNAQAIANGAGVISQMTLGWGQFEDNEVGLPTAEATFSGLATDGVPVAGTASCMTVNSAPSVKLSWRTVGAPTTTPIQSATTPTQPQRAPAAPTPTAPSASCSSAWRAAAAIPRGDVNDAQLSVTTSQCTTVNEWLGGLVRNPNAMAVDNTTLQEAITALDGLCRHYDAQAPTCKDARALGLI
jgi:hypothetical protein